jgi:putative FmdB family regulatory protein
MPLYEYLCAKCGEKFEVLQKFSDAQLTVHEACGGAVERLISRSGFSLKGSGWYATDYAKGGSSSQTDAKKDSGEDSSKTKTESKPAETKTETKTESKPASSTTKTD